MQTLFNIVFSASLASVSALAFYPILITNRAFILSAALSYLAGGYVYLAVVSSSSTFVGVIAGILAAASLSALVDSCIVRPFREAGLPSWKLLVVTLGVFVIGQNVFSVVFGDDAIPLKAGVVQAGFAVLGGHVGPIQMLTIVSACIVATLIWFVLNRTDIGRTIRAVFSNPELAFILGHNPEQIRVRSAIVGGAVAGLTGILVGLDTGMAPALGFRLLSGGIVVILIAGMSGVLPIIFGALLLAVLQNLVTMFLGIAWMESVAYLVLVAFLIWKPHGLTGRRLKRVEV